MVNGFLRADINVKACWAALALMLLAALAVMMHRHPPNGELYFGDSAVFTVAGERVVAGEDPYEGAVVEYEENGLPFISPPVVAMTFGGLYWILGPALMGVMMFSHFVALIGSPWIQTRLFLGPKPSHLALGFGVFACSIGAAAVTTFVSGNFGASMHFAIIATMAHGLRKGQWRWMHLAIALSCLVKPTYAAYWIVPVLWQGWNWREVKNAAIVAGIVALIYAVSYVANPSYFDAWLGSLNRQVSGTGDYGHSVYGQLAWRMIFDEHQHTLIPYLAHIAVMGALLAFILLDKTTGLRKAAALIVFSILVNPRMKEYDMAFAAVPLAALYLSALIPPTADAMRRALAIAATVAIFFALLIADNLPIVGPFMYVIAMSAGILTLALKRPDLPANP